MRHHLSHGGGVHTYGKRGQGGPICEGNTGVFDAQSGGDELWRVRGQQGGDRLNVNPLSSSNSKHIDVRHHFLREMAPPGDISAQYLRSEDQHADILTKAIGRASF